MSNYLFFKSSHIQQLSSTKKSHRFKKILSHTLAVFAFVFFTSLLFILYLRAQPLPNVVIPQSSQILDVQGKVIDQFYVGQNRESVPLKHISPYVIQATLAIEDERFFEHFGIDLKGVARAAVTNMKHFDQVEGASTLTQQLARNLFLNQERNWERKIKEAVYALQLETQYDKKTILELYLNQIYFGHSTYGVQAASHLFFGKDAKDLTLAESALLVGIPNGPYYYSPFLNMDNAVKRQRIILNKMVELSLITEEQKDLAIAEELTFQTLETSVPHHAPYFRDYVKQIAIHELGIDEKTFTQGGLKVYTSLDLRVQHIAEEVIQEETASKDEQLQAALIAIDPRTGHIKAMVGGRDYEKNQFNRSLTKARQPGSSFKPIVYLTALEQQKATAITKYKSEPTSFIYDEGREVYKPRNFGNTYANEEIDMRYAISRSDNIYAVHSLQEAGVEHVMEMAKKLGIQSELDPVPSLALGTSPISPLEMASAYATIANQGQYHKPLAILKIEDAFGRTMYEANQRSIPVIEPAYTYVLTNLMQSVLEQGGTGHRIAHLVKRPVAAKTGTTDRDAWMVGFTPELSTAVWIGYDKDKMISAAESMIASPIFASFTERSLSSIPPKPFITNANVVSAYIDPATGDIATSDCENARLEMFVAGTEPTSFCALHDEASTKQGIPVDEQSETWWKSLKRWWNE
ncbi:transglycosylase domain-containing protein [Longirhabdus pacifica]|uniref:transglycosylase domain-containing protein n=1 Tax=Longirhabdus pacifica TaxID=2305227 RepID=UPI0013E8ADA7|nr:transglycosylase domain-containing protein [Longirhabdus pacifica]